MDPKQQGLSVMLTNALRSNAAFEFERNTSLAKPRQAVILPIGGRGTGFAGQTVRETDQVNLGQVALAAQHPVVEISPRQSVRRRMVSAPGMTVELVQETGSERIDYHFVAPIHLLVLFERGVRREGETNVDGLAPSTLRQLTCKFVFVPAGHKYCDRHEASTPARITFFYFDPAELPGAANLGAVPLAPRLFFEDPHLLATARKLAELIDGLESDNRCYIEALGRVLAHELTRLNRGGTPRKGAVRGGLAAWQQRIVTSHIEDHLAEPIPVSTLAELVGLSTYHFCRAFKQSFGIPPHRYHTSRRIDRAKALLAKPAPSVTSIGLMVGFSETSSFSAAFRKATGFTPTAYHRSLA
jgi:AraC family transcriptional regulator